MARTVYFTAPYEVAVRETSVSDPAPEELVVEASVSAISPGTELLLYRGEMPDSLPADVSIDALEGDLSYPARYGYAAVGDVIDAGSAVDDAWVGRVNDRYDLDSPLFRLWERLLRRERERLAAGDE